MNDTKIILSDLSMQDVNMILAGLGELPLKASVELWMRVKQQGEAQLKQEPVAAGLDE